MSEEAMAYHPTDIDLRLFYLIVLYDLGHKEKVYEHIVALLRYNEFHEEQGREEFAEIVLAMYHFLRDEDISHIIRDWPLTTNRQLFRYHVFEIKHRRFKALEALYNSGVRSTYLYAETVYHLNHNPEIPSKQSPYYKFILRWAIAKQYIDQLWIEKLELGYYQLLKYHLIDSGLCGKLYEMLPKEGILKMYCTTLMEEGIISSEAYSVYYEVLRQKIFIKDALIHYIMAGYQNRLKMDMNLISLATIERRLGHNEMAYVYTQYLSHRFDDQSAYNVFRRHFTKFIPDCIHGQMTNDEISLMAFFLSSLLEKHQWNEIKDYTVEGLLDQIWPLDKTIVADIINHGARGLDYEWIRTHVKAAIIMESTDDENKIGYLNYLINSEDFHTLMSLYSSGHLAMVSEALLEKVALAVYHNHNEFGRVILNQLYKKGNQNPKILEVLSKDFRALLGDMIELYELCQSHQLTSNDLMEKILYRGVMIRGYQESLLKVYRCYRNHKPNEKVVAVMNRFFAAQILIEELMIDQALIGIFEEDLYKSKDQLPIGLALLKLYQQIGGVSNEVILSNLVKKML